MERLRTLLEKARTAEAAEDLVTAAVVYQEILRIKPGWGAAELNLALVLASRRDHKGALTYFDLALRHDASLVSAHLGRGAALYNLERFGESIPPLERYASAKPDDTDVHYYLGRAFAALGDHARAISRFREQLRLTPANPDALFYLADSARLLCAGLAKQLADDPNGAYFFTLVTAEEPRETGDSRLLDAIVKEPARPEAYVTLGLLQLRRKQTREAAASFQEAWKRDSSDCRISTTCGVERDLSANFENTKRPEDAYSVFVRAKRIAEWGFQKLAEIAPSSPLVAQARAYLSEQSGNLDDAEQHYRSAVERSRRDVASLTDYAKFQARLSRFGEAGVLLREALSKEPGSPMIAALLGEVLFVMGDSPAALSHLRRASAARPADEQTRSYLAQCLAKLGRPADAIRVLEAAPADPGGRLSFQLGTLYRRMGNAEKAERAFSIYRERRGSR